MSVTGKGFTLIELLVVLAILVLIASALPSALNASFPGRRLAAATEDAAAQMRETRFQARAAGLERILIADAHAPGTLAGDRLRLPDPIEAAWEPGPSIASAAGPTFFADGSATPGQLVLHLGPRERRIRVTGLSGRIETMP